MIYSAIVRPDASERKVKAVRAFCAFIATLAIFGVLAYASIQLTRGTERIAFVWLPNALALVYLLRARVPNLPAFFAACLMGNIAANLVVGDSVVAALNLSVANGLEIALALFLVRRWCGPHADMNNIAHVSRFMIAAGIVAPTVSAVAASFTVTAGWQGNWLELLRWVMSDGLSMLIIAPSAMVFVDALRIRRTPTGRECAEWVLLTTAGTLLTLLVFAQTSFPLLFLVPPIVVAHAFRLGTLGTAFSVVKVAAIALVFTGMGSGPINLVPVSPELQILVLEGFLASATVMGLPVAAVLSTRGRMIGELAHGKRQLAMLTENITDAILRYDADGVCTYASPWVKTVLGLPPEAFVGTTTDDRTHPDSREKIATVRDRLLGGESRFERLTYRRYLDGESGQPVYIEADCAVAEDPERPGKPDIVVSARDVTKRVELERKLKRATLHAENAARAKAQFLANMSHEIRTPMNGVLGFADMLRRMPLDGDAARYADLIARSGRSMMMLLNDILDISKIESGQLVLGFEEFDLQQLVEDCVQLHRTSAERKAVALRVGFATDLPAKVISDPLRLRQILLNLIGNAVKFTEQGGVEIAVGRLDGKLEITVRDSGIGIAPARMEQIFDPFIQAESSTTRRFGGTGLGLSISRQLADLLDGTLEADSQPGIGSCFTLRVPLEAAGGKHIPRREDRGALPAALPPRRRILLAEDHDVNRMLAVAMLEQLGQDVRVAQDGLEAVTFASQARDEGSPFDLVLMDIQMPGCDGYSATRMIRKAGLDGATLPILALTANAYADDVEAAHEAGMQGHLAKPLVFQELADALSRWLPVAIVEEDRSTGSTKTARASGHIPGGPPATPAPPLPIRPKCWSGGPHVAARRSMRSPSPCGRTRSKASVSRTWQERFTSWPALRRCSARKCWGKKPALSNAPCAHG